MHDFYSIFGLFRQFPTFNFLLDHSGSEPFNWQAFLVRYFVHTSIIHCVMHAKISVGLFMKGTALHHCDVIDINRLQVLYYNRRRMFFTVRLHAHNVCSLLYAHDLFGILKISFV